VAEFDRHAGSDRCADDIAATRRRCGDHAVASSTPAGEGVRHARPPQRRTSRCDPDGQLARAGVRGARRSNHERGSILDEQLAAWEQIWSHEAASFAGDHYRFDDIHVEPKACRAGGPTLWFGGSTMHPRLLDRLVRYGHGYNPFGAPSDQELASLRRALVGAGRDPALFELVGGVRATFPDGHSPADVDQALEAVPQQLANGFTTICVKPSMFIDELSELASFCSTFVEKLSALAE